MLTRTLTEYIAGAADRALPADVAAKAGLHVMDTIAAMVSGSRLGAGRKIIPFIAGQGGTPEAGVIGATVVTSAVNAALANGMMAHANETDDSHAPSLNHPGCAIVPAALAVAERQGSSGAQLIRAVSTGYDVGTRISLALGHDGFFGRGHSSHAFGGLFGATAACSVLLGLTAAQVANAFGYSVQQAAGNTCWRRDPDHVEKAFVFGGMPAQHGVLSALFAAEGFVGSFQALEGNPGLFSAFPDEAQPDLAIEELGSRFEVMRTTIKKWSVGSPINSALGALSVLIAEHRFGPADIARITVNLPSRRAAVVQNPTTADLNLPHQLALLLTDGSLTFTASHDHARLHDAGLSALRSRISVEGRDSGTHRHAIVTVELADGRKWERVVEHVPGTPGNPMTTEEVATKARDLMVPVLGNSGATLTEKLLALDTVADMRTLRPLMQI